jgi:hypothetical protein
MDPPNKGPSSGGGGWTERMVQFAIYVCLIGFGALSTTAVGALRDAGRVQPTLRRQVILPPSWDAYFPQLVDTRTVPQRDPSVSASASPATVRH